ncbi:unnamed protein product [Auanema sp. JU1783]|nr:unnamed protein product [Auanema sp. JU1783]
MLDLKSSEQKNSVHTYRPMPLYPRRPSASSSLLQALLLEESSGAMLSTTQRPPSDPSSVSTEGLLLLALQERINSQNRSLNNITAPANGNNGDINRFWQSLMMGLPPIVPGINNPLDLNFMQGTPVSHPLWQHNLCAWPSCNQPCENITVFLAHLAQTHTSDDRATADMRSQVELVDTLEHRLTKERNKLQAMMQHLHMKHSPDTTTPSVGKVETSSPSPLRAPKQEPAVTSAPATPNTHPIQITSTLPLMLGDQSSTTPATSEASPNPDLKPFVPRRSRISDKTVLPISADIARNREFYRTNDVRPPYTYASLIRQAIMESPECQLTLNEIYTWFTDTFAYFRRNAATWKNAVRHNLSLHKCFQRVEQNVKGAVWTVDDSEFYRRRPQRSAATRSQPNTPLPDELMAQRLIDQTTMSLIESRDGSHLSDGLTLGGGFEGVLSFLAAAVSEHSSNAPSPISNNVKEQDENLEDDEIILQKEEQTPPNEERLIVDEQTAVSTSC